MGLAENVKRLRRMKKLSQHSLAERAGVSQQLISQIERDVNGSTKDLPAIATVLGVNVDELDPRFSSSAPTGFSEPDVEPWVAPNHVQRDILRVIAPDAKTPTGYRLLKHYEGLSFQKGDVLIVDLNSAASNGDTVLVNVADVETGSAETVLGRLFHPWLFSNLTADPVALDNTTAVMGKVVGSFREPDNK